MGQSRDGTDMGWASAGQDNHGTGQCTGQSQDGTVRGRDNHGTGQI